MKNHSKLSASSLLNPALKEALTNLSEANFFLWLETRNLQDWRRADLETACQSLIFARNELDATIKELVEAVNKVEPWTNAHLKN